MHACQLHGAGTCRPQAPPLIPRGRGVTIKLDDATRWRKSKPSSRRPNLDALQRPSGMVQERAVASLSFLSCGKPNLARTAPKLYREMVGVFPSPPKSTNVKKRTWERPGRCPSSLACLLSAATKTICCCCLRMLLRAQTRCVLAGAGLGFTCCSATKNTHTTMWRAPATGGDVFATNSLADGGYKICVVHASKRNVSAPYGAASHNILLTGAPVVTR